MNRLKLAEQIWIVTDKLSPAEANIETKRGIKNPRTKIKY